MASVAEAPTEEPAAAEPVPRRTLFCYGLADMPIQMAGIPVLSLVPAYYTSSLGVGVAAASAVLLGSRLFDAVTDPLIGWLSDRTNSRYGRRRLWMAASVPVFMLAIYKLFMPSGPVDAFYMLTWLVVFWLGWTMLFIPYYAWGAEISPDYNERTRVTAWRTGIGLGASVVSKLVPVLAGFFLGMAAIGDNLLLIGIMMLVLLPLTVGGTLFGVTERTDYLPPRLPLLPGLKVMWRNGPFKRLVLALFVNQLGAAISTVTVALFILDALDQKEHVMLMLLVFFTFNLAGVPFWLRIARRIDKHHAWCFGLFGFAGFHCVYMLLGPGDFYLMLPITACTGFLGASFAVVPTSMLADIADIDTLESGEDRAAWYFAVWSFVVKVGQSVGPALAFALLAWVGYDPSEGATNTEGEILGLRMLYAFGPAIGFAICALIAWNYPLTREKHQGIRAQLQAVRDESAQAD